MKKLLTVFALMLFSTGLYAQEAFEFGIKGGLNLSGYLANDDLALYQNNTAVRAGWNAGVYGRINVSEKFSIQPEILYSLQGVNFVDSEIYVDYIYVENFFAPDYVAPVSGTYGEIVAKENLHYLNVPILANIYLTDNFSFQIGPQFGFLMNATARFNTEDDEVNDIFNDFEESNDITGSYNGFSMAAAAGFQLELPSNVDLGLRYNFGLNDIVEDGDADEIQITNQVGQLYVGYTF